MWLTLIQSSKKVVLEKASDAFCQSLLGIQNECIFKNRETLTCWVSPVNKEASRSSMTCQKNQIVIELCFCC